MSSLVVGGVAIKVAVSSPRWTRSDGVDRSRSLDGTLRASQTGGAVRVWDFETPPVLASTEGETYKAALSTVASQLCSGDIIAIPTMCSSELTDGVPTSVAGAPYVVLSFTLHEQQPAKTLLRYSPGDTITGESFSRSTTAYQINAAGLLVSAAINAKRDAHYIGGVRSTLLEVARTNSLLWSTDFTNAVWTKSTCTVTPGITDPTGGTGAQRLTATAAGAYAYQGLPDAASLVRTNSLWVSRYNGAGDILLYKPDGTASVIVPPVTPAWGRFSVTGPAVVGRFSGINIATNGDIVDVWNEQMDDGASASSEIPTTTVAVTRGSDVYSLPFTTPPQETTLYVKFVEKGTTVIGSAYLAAITSAGGGSPQFAVNMNDRLRAYHNNTLNAMASENTISASIGDTTEVCARLFGDGSVELAQSINGGAETTTVQSGPLTLAAAWAGLLLTINSNGTGGGNSGLTAIQSLKIVAGSRSLQEMRSL